jgi:hypothetical protein
VESLNHDVMLCVPHREAEGQEEFIMKKKLGRGLFLNGCCGQENA